MTAEGMLEIGILLAELLILLILIVLLIFLGPILIVFSAMAGFLLLELAGGSSGFFQRTSIFSPHLLSLPSPFRLLVSATGGTSIHASIAPKKIPVTKFASCPRIGKSRRSCGGRPKGRARTNTNLALTTAYREWNQKATRS